jgi:16S rRNA (guanine966-N2)-methyltransferase
MRVVAGELGGRRIAAPKGVSIRPTTDRVREAVFAILGGLTASASILDLYAGTGAVAIEALSRGAARATIVDIDPRPAEENVAAFDLGDRCTVVRSDALRFLRGDGARYDLVYCDPPYRLARRIASDLEELLPPRLLDGGRVIVESAASDPLVLGLPLLDGRAYGQTAIRIHGAPR